MVKSLIFRLVIKPKPTYQLSNEIYKCFTRSKIILTVNDELH